MTSYLKLTFCLVLFLTWTSCSRKASEKPNILLIVADDLGFSDLGCYGGEIETPTLDQLAQNGLRLTRFYSTGRCCPSRASLLTGLYPHRAGLGHKVEDLGQPGYRGRIAGDAVTLAQMLVPAGYRCFMSGKWHLGTEDPTDHGFEQFYGTLVSAQTYWDQHHYLRLPKDASKRIYEAHAFYGTNAITDHALDFLEEARSTSERPWFLYLAYNAPHFPLHAPQATVQKYLDGYRVGWDSIRQQRLSRLKSLGIIPAQTSLSPRSRYWNYGQEQTGVNPPWNNLTDERKEDLIHRMAIYAAMVDIMDQNIGRVITDLRENGQFENTIIMFVSDNGACAEWDPYGFDIRSGPVNVLHRGDSLKSMGSPGTYHSVGSGWANASNTPWRLYKHYNHEGGISTPFIIHWPAGMSRTGAIDHTPAHLIDIVPTTLALTRVNYPYQLNGQPLAPLAGKSLAPVLNGQRLEDRTLFFEHEGNRAVIDGGWKISAISEQPWELYNILEDRTELVDLAAVHPEVVSSLSTDWDRWAHENFVTPLPADYKVKYLKSPGSMLITE